MLHKDGLCGGAAEIADKTSRILFVAAALDHGYGIHDGFMRRIRSRSHNANLAGDLCVGRVDETRIRISGLNIGQNLAHILGEHKLCAELLQQMKGRQRLTSILPGRNACRVAESNRAH
jgi:hypothetical protein